MLKTSRSKKLLEITPYAENIIFNKIMKFFLLKGMC